MLLKLQSGAPTDEEEEEDAWEEVAQAGHAGPDSIELTLDAPAGRPSTLSLLSCTIGSALSRCPAAWDGAGVPPLLRAGRQKAAAGKSPRALTRQEKWEQKQINEYKRIINKASRGGCRRCALPLIAMPCPAWVTTFRRGACAQGEAELAGVLHRANLLCLLANGLLLDEAANDPVVQVSTPAPPTLSHIGAASQQWLQPATRPQTQVAPAGSMTRISVA